MDPMIKLRSTIDALFGAGVSRHLPPKRDIEITYSKRTGRIKSVFYKKNLLCTLRIDGGLAISLTLAQILLDKSKIFRESCVEITLDSKPFVEQGYSVFAKHVTWCGKNVKILGDTPILYKNKVVAVGRAVLSAEQIGDLTHGVAIKVRNSLKSQSDTHTV